MNLAKTIILTCLVVIAVSRSAIEDDDQTIGWGKQALAEEISGSQTGDMLLALVEGEQGLGLGLDHETGVLQQ